MSIDSNNTFVYSPLDLNTATGSSTGANTPVASVSASGTASVFNVAKRIQVTLCGSSAAVQVPIVVQLYNSSASNTSPIASWSLTAAPASGGTVPGLVVDLDNLHIVGSSNAAMCVSTSTAGAASQVIALNLQTYLLGKANFTALANKA